METVAPDRRLALQGCFNFRDLGGYRGAGGLRVRWRRLFRADSLSRLTPDDLERLGDMGLATVVDLRTASELSERGRPYWPDPVPGYHHLPLVDVLPPVEEYADWSDPAHVADRYLEILASGGPAVTGALHVLADPVAHPAVVHCTAGKDRTGIVSALVLGLLGVDDDDIVADYALSREGAQRMLSWLRREHPEAGERIEASAVAIVAAEPATMRLFLGGLRSRYGSFEGYADLAGLADEVVRLRSSLLES